MPDTLKSFIIGETAYNHEGDMGYLRGMICDIAEMGLDAVKVHLLLNPVSYMQKKNPVVKEVEKWIFTRDEWESIFDRASAKGLKVVALCDDVESLEFVNALGKNVDFIELHATGLNDWFLLEEAANFKGRVILGIGGSMIDEIQYAVDFLNNKGKKDIMLMYGFQSYPTNYADINLSKMIKIRNMFDLETGYADHTGFDDPNNELISVMGAMMGINILEKHYTPDFGKKRIDFHAAVGKEKMLKIKELMDVALKAHGSGELKMSQPELNYGNTGPMKKAIVARTDIKKGEKLSFDNLWFKRTEEESPVKQNQLLQLVGLEAVRDIPEDEIIDFSKVAYKFNKHNFGNITKLDQPGEKK